MSRFLIVCTAVLSLLLAHLTAAQEATLQLPPSVPAPANLAHVDGAVDVIHEAVAEPAAAGTMLFDGDVVRTANGRAELVFADGTLLHLDHDTDLEILSPSRLRLREGRVLLRVSAAATAPYVVDTQASSVNLHSRGEYGVSASGRFERLEITVARGVAELDDQGGRTSVRGGEMATIVGIGGRVLLQSFNSARFGAFELWASERANGFAAAPSARQLPVELRPYGPVLDRYGRWDYLAPYGYVWYPAVAAAWRPYYTGAWLSTRYGHTWIGHDPWSWPTHHYGRWGFTGASWYWIPNGVWGPAWVSFSFVSNYVSWCPLGWDGRPVFAFYGPGRPGLHHDFYPNYDPWRGWTVAPRHAFGARRAVHTYALDPAGLPDDARRAMANAVPRAVTPLPNPRRSGNGGLGSVASDSPITSPRGYAVPRGSATPSGPVRIEPPGNFARRGNVRRPITERVDAPRLYSPRVDAPAVAGSGAVSPRLATPSAEAPRVESVVEPRSYTRGEYSRPDVARPRREESPSRDERRVRGEAPVRQDAPARSDRPSSRAERPSSREDSGRSSGGAAPRSGRQQPQSGSQSGGNGGGSGGAARRRPGI